MQIRAVQTTWNKLQNIVYNYAVSEKEKMENNRARKDMTDKIMTGVYRTVISELQRMEMNSEVRGRTVRGNRAVLIVDIKIETEKFHFEPVYERKTLSVQLDDIINKKLEKKLIEY